MPGPRRCFGISRCVRRARSTMRERLLPVAHILRREGLPLDIVEHQHARLRIDDLRSDARGMGRAAHRHLVAADDAVHLDVAAEADDEFAAAVLDDEIDVAHAAAAARSASTGSLQIGSAAACRQAAPTWRSRSRRFVSAKAEPPLHPFGRGRHHAVGDHGDHGDAEPGDDARGRHPPWRARYRLPAQGRACRQAR